MKLFFIIIILFFSLSALCQEDQDIVTNWRTKVDSVLETFRNEKLDYNSIYKSGDRTLETSLSELLTISEQRSLYIEDKWEKGELNLYEIGTERFTDLKRELKIIPIKWLALLKSKYVQFISYFKQGFSGIKNLIWDLFILIVLLFFFVWAWKGIKNISTFLERYRKELVRNHYRDISKIKIAKFIRTINPYIPWVLSYIALFICKDLVETSSFSDFAILIPYLQLYILYQLSKSIFKNIFELFVNSKNELPLKDQYKKVENSSKKLSRVIFFYYFILYSINSVISRGISYHLFENAFRVIILFFILLIAYNWRKEVLRKIKSFQIENLSKVSDKLLTGFLSVFFSVPLLFIGLLLIFSDKALQWLSQFEFSKKITAQLFKKRLSNAENIEENKKQIIPDDYKDLFLKNDSSINQNFLFFPEESIYHRIKTEIDEWVLDPAEENSIAFYGEKGMGKTTILNQIENDFQNIKTVRLNIDKRLTTAQDVYDFFGEFFEIQSPTTLIPFVTKFKNLDKTLIMLDETHNLFLSKLGGFSAYKAFLELINIQSDNIFWLASFNLHAWNFLNAVTGKNNYFRLTFKVPHWSDNSIKKLILNRHETTDYKLSFSELLKATRVNDEVDSDEYIEDQFFRLLWEHSNGIPQIALYQWLTSIKPAWKTFKVGLPHDDEVHILKGQSDDTLFIFAALLKHENLSAKDVIQVTNIPEGTVRNTLKFGVDNQLLVKNKGGKYTISYKYQINVVNFLKKKNFIYAT